MTWSLPRMSALLRWWHSSITSLQPLREVTAARREREQFASRMSHRCRAGWGRGRASAFRRTDDVRRKPDATAWDSGALRQIVHERGAAGAVDDPVVARERDR